MSLVLHGIGVSRGVAIGRVRVLNYAKPSWRKESITPEQLPAELRRLDAAVAKARENLQLLQQQIPDNIRAQLSDFINTHILMLADQLLVGKPGQIIESELCNAEWAVRRNCDALAAMFDAMEDPYLRARKEDVIHVSERILLILSNQAQPDSASDAKLRGCIVVAEDLSAEDIVLFRQREAAAFVTEHGGRTSHAAIIARSMQIPTVVGLRRLSRQLFEDELLIVDGDCGVVLAEPDKRIIRHYEKKLRKGLRRKAALARLRRQPSCTRDGVAVRLQANVELPEDFAAARALGAAGVGLYRTEFLYMNRDLPPDEEEHYAAYCAALQELTGLPLCIRTLDLGADVIPYGQAGALPAQDNPAMGLRGIRFCLQEPTLFLPQLRAILRASARGQVRLLVPMLSSVEELQRLLSILDGLRREFDEQRIPHDPAMPVGGMIEVPAAAVCADSFARRLDFFAIGSNDLAQYALAADRGNDQLSHLCDPLHPAVLTFIGMVLDAGRAARIPVTLCGEIASEIDYTRLFLALGLRDLSVHLDVLPELRQCINESTIGDLTRYRRRIEQARTPEDLEAVIDALNAAGPDQG